jgi:dTDP-4-amino-4,6-dideoxygalactose transaminase
VKLPHLLEWNQRRRYVAERYRSELADMPICLPSVTEGGDHVWHLFVLRSAERDRLQRHLAECGVQTLLHYPVPPHLQAAYGALGLREGDFPIAEAIHRECLSLPMGPHLPEEHVTVVVDSMRSFPFEDQQPIAR